MHVKFYMPEILSAAGNSYKVFLYNIQSLNTEDIFQFSQNFPCVFTFITWNQASVIVIIYSIDGFSIVPLKGFICNMFLTEKKWDILAIPALTFDQKTKFFRKKYWNKKLEA